MKVELLLHVDFLTLRQVVACTIFYYHVEVSHCTVIVGSLVHDSIDTRTALTTCILYWICSSSRESGNISFIALVVDSASICRTIIVSSCESRQRTCWYSSILYQIICLKRYLIVRERKVDGMLLHCYRQCGRFTSVATTCCLSDVYGSRTCSCRIQRQHTIRACCIAYHNDACVAGDCSKCSSAETFNFKLYVRVISIYHRAWYFLAIPSHCYSVR